MVSPWKSTKDALKILGIHHNHLYNLRTELTRGKHWRNIKSQNARRSTYQWHVSNIEKYLQTPAEKR